MTLCFNLGPRFEAAARPVREPGRKSTGLTPTANGGIVVSARRLIVLLVMAAHGLVLWLFWRERAPVENEVEAIPSVMFFFPEPYQSTLQPSIHPIDRGAPRSSAPVAPLPPAATSPALVPSAPPRAGIDWSAQLTGAANATLADEKKTREQLGALLRKFHSDADPRDPLPDPRSGFRWYDAGIHRFDTRGFLPAWHLNERCVLVAFIFAACAIGHIEEHGDLFDGAAARHDEMLATHRPNDAP